MLREVSVASEIVAGSVLLVDDEPAILAAVRRTLRVLPLKIRIACCAKEALALVEAEVPRLVISDYQMPGMDGLSLLAHIRARHPQVACILHTGTSPLPHRFGLDIPVLAKPCESAALVDLVRSLVGASARCEEPRAASTSTG